uniref:Uncharacterized protein n=1 Tax=Glossina brevipalpis TaxID=37001 RepID=A0A1A9X4P7_9MUSC
MKSKTKTIDFRINRHLPRHQIIKDLCLISIINNYTRLSDPIKPFIGSREAVAGILGAVLGFLGFRAVVDLRYILHILAESRTNLMLRWPNLQIYKVQPGLWRSILIIES